MYYIVLLILIYVHKIIFSIVFKVVLVVPLQYIYNVLGLCVVALSRNLKLTTTLDRAITQNPCYVPFLF